MICLGTRTAVRRAGSDGVAPGPPAGAGTWRRWQFGQMDADTNPHDPVEPEREPAPADDTELDPDADPRNLHPRTGAAAHSDVPVDEDADTDAEPGNLNPRARDE